MPHGCAALGLEVVGSCGSRARWRAGGVGGNIGVLPLARRGDVATLPRSRALRCKVEKASAAARSWRAGGPTSHRCGYQLASCRLVVCCRVDARELPGESRLVVKPRAVDGRATLTEPTLSNSQVLNTSNHTVRERFLTMQSTRRRNRPFAQTGQYCRRGLLRR